MLKWISCNFIFPSCTVMKNIFSSDELEVRSTVFLLGTRREKFQLNYSYYFELTKPCGSSRTSNIGGEMYNYIVVCVFLVIR